MHQFGFDLSTVTGHARKACSVPGQLRIIRMHGTGVILKRGARQPVPVSLTLHSAGTVHGAMVDRRAGPEIDRVLVETGHAASRKPACPVCALFRRDDLENLRGNTLS